MPGEVSGCNACNGHRTMSCAAQKLPKKEAEKINQGIKQCGSGSKKQAKQVGDQADPRPKPRRMTVYKPPEDVTLERVVSRELRGSVLYVDCDCYHRNGLQHDCPRHKCSLERQKCLIQPWPSCELGKYYLDKWARHEEARRPKPKPTTCVPLSFDLTPRYADEKENTNQGHQKCPHHQDKTKKSNGCGSVKPDLGAKCALDSSREMQNCCVKCGRGCSSEVNPCGSGNKQVLCDLCCGRNSRKPEQTFCGSSQKKPKCENCCDDEYGCGESRSRQKNTCGPCRDQTMIDEPKKCDKKKKQDENICSNKAGKFTFG